MSAVFLGYFLRVPTSPFLTPAFERLACHAGRCVTRQNKVRQKEAPHYFLNCNSEFFSCRFHSQKSLSCWRVSPSSVLSVISRGNQRWRRVNVDCFLRQLSLKTPPTSRFSPFAFSRFRSPGLSRRLVRGGQAKTTLAEKVSFCLNKNQFFSFRLACVAGAWK